MLILQNMETRRLSDIINARNMLTDVEFLERELTKVSVKNFFKL